MTEDIHCSGCRHLSPDWQEDREEVRDLIKWLFENKRIDQNGLFVAKEVIEVLSDPSQWISEYNEMYREKLGSQRQMYDEIQLTQTFHRAFINWIRG